MSSCRFIADHSGFVGVTMFPPFLKRGTAATVDDYVEAIEYVINLCGEDSVGIGTDFTQGYGDEFFDWITHDKGSGASSIEFGDDHQPRGHAQHRRIPQPDGGDGEARLAREPHRKVMGGNWLQLLKDVWRA